MLIRFSHPNDYGSEQAIVAMNEFFGFDEETDPSTMEETIVQKIAEIAEENGLEPTKPSEFGHSFAGTIAQIEAAKAAMPSWVSSDAIEEDE